MKLLILFCACFSVVLSDGGVADDCISEKCTIENNCRCSNEKSPIVDDVTLYPQLISLTFAESITEEIVTNYWKPLLFDLANPDDAAIGATFFVPHDYTDYTQVNLLYSFGFEIGVNSITNNPLQSYWREASEELLEQEFGGQKTILVNFANIKEEDIIGARIPQLQFAGNYSIKAYQSSNLQYDSSWPTIPNIRLFPYTLDFRSTQQCTLGTKCPNEAFPGFWILPINDLNGDGKECSVLMSCGVNGTADDIANWLDAELEKVKTTRVPLTLLVTSSWFIGSDDNLAGFKKFINNQLEKKDTFFVSQKQVMSWIKNPEKLDTFKTDFPDVTTTCNKERCTLKDINNKSRYMGSCVPCPAVYPWLGNPNGIVQENLNSFENME